MILRRLIAWTGAGTLAISCVVCHATRLVRGGSTGRLPLHVQFAYFDRAHAKAYALVKTAVGGVITYVPGGRTYEVGDPTGASVAILSSPDRSKIIVQAGDSYVLRSIDLRLVRTIHGEAWWEHGGISCLRHGNRDSVHHFRGTVCKAPVGVSLFVPDEHGAYLLGGRMVNPGSDENGNCPTYRFSLYRNASHSISAIRPLYTSLFPVGSVSSPSHLAVLDSRNAVFGVPDGRADLYDYLGILSRGHVADAPLSIHGRPLSFEQPPVLAGSAIITVATALNSNHTKSEARYVVIITRTGSKVRELDPTVAFLAYDQGHRTIGIGRRGQSSSCVEWVPRDRIVNRSGLLK